MRIRIKDITTIEYASFKKYFKDVSEYQFETDCFALYFNVRKSKASYVITTGSDLFLLIKSYAGDGFDCLFLVRSKTDISEALKNVIDACAKAVVDFEREYLIVRNVNEDFFYKVLTDGNFESRRVISTLDAYNIFGQLYPLESNFPQIIIKVPSQNDCLDGISFPNCLNGSGLSLFAGSTNRRLRYEINRINRSFNLEISDDVSLSAFNRLLDDWILQMDSKRGNTKQVKVFNRDYSLDHFNQRWLYPLKSFLSFLQTEGLCSEFIKRHIQTTDRLNRGVWIGSVKGNCLLIYTILTTRRNPLFADTLLLDIISYCSVRNISWINLGGAEDVSLYNFKKKYFRFFEGSIKHKSYDIFLGRIA